MQMQGPSHSGGGPLHGVELHLVVSGVEKPVELRICAFLVQKSVAKIFPRLRPLDSSESYIGMTSRKPAKPLRRRRPISNCTKKPIDLTRLKMQLLS
jgi:hypothetical protein